MADMIVTPARVGLTPQQWDSEFFFEYVRENQFAPFMGSAMNSLFQIKDDLSRKHGDSVTFAAVRKLVGQGVVNGTTLEGNEEQLDARALKLSVYLFRHGFAVNDWDAQKSAIDLRNAGREALKTWSMEKMRNDIIVGLQSMDGVQFSQATSAQKNAWMTNNSDRVLFGSARANASSGVMGTALATITNGYSPATQGNLSANSVSLAKRIAKTAHPGIRPTKIKGGAEYFVMFANSLSFRDLKADPTIVSSRQQAMPRSEQNPLFMDGDIMWDGVIVKEVPELTIVPGTGAGGIDVGMNVLCGAQALGLAWAQRSQTRTNTRDYEFQHGVAVQEIRGIGKLRFGTDPNNESGTLKDHGVVTVFSSAVADA